MESTSRKLEASEDTKLLNSWRHQRF